MALVHEEQEVLGEEVQQGHGGGAHRAAGDDPGVVLDAGAVAQLRQHLHVVLRPLADALGLHQLALVLKDLHLVLQFPLDLHDGLFHLVPGGDIVAGGVDGDVVQPALRDAGDGVELADAVDLIPEELHPDGLVLVVGGPDLHGVAPDPEEVPGKGHVVALVAALHETAQELVPGQLHAGAEGDGQLREVVRLAQAVDAAHRRHHDDIPPLQQGEGGGEPQAVDLLVGGGVLGDIGIRVGDIGLGLVVIVVAHEVLHGVLREELLELRAELGGQGLVVGQDQGGALDLLDDLGHGIGLTGAGDAQQDLLI